MVNILGLDIGGANVKAASADGHSICRPFEIWKEPDRLPEILNDLANQLVEQSGSKFDLLAITMTAELADCFQTKAEGVDAILRSVEQVANSIPIVVWQTGAEFITPDIARDIPFLVAAANWHALATFVGRVVPQSSAVLIDIGSTTTDIIPLLNGVPIPHGLTDVERLQSGELVYSGVGRTPLCAIAHTVPFRDTYCPMAAEFFASSLDIYLTLGEISEDRNDTRTANGKPATIEAAHDRIARMLCCDRLEFTADDAESVSRFLADVQKQRLAGPLERVLARLNQTCEVVLISGEGSFLARTLATENPRCQNADKIALAEIFSAEVSESACAFAVARLAAERIVL